MHQIRMSYFWSLSDLRTAESSPRGALTLSSGRRGWPTRIGMGQAARTSSGSLLTATIVHGLRCSTCSSPATSTSR